MTFASRVLVLLALAAMPASPAAEASMANPIRRVVNMLQQMQTKVEEEGKKEEKLYEKFMCYCKTGTDDLTASIDAAETKIPQVEASLKAEEELLAQLTAELAEHKTSLKDAEDAVAAAKAQREKEQAAYAKLSTDYTANILAMGKAIVAIEKGSQTEKVKGFGFLQTFLQSAEAKVVKKMTIEMDMNPMDRDVISAFLSSSQNSGYVPQSGQIVGILKQMKDTMEADLKAAIAAEEQAITDFQVLTSAKTKEIKANTAAIESKTERKGEAEVNIVNMKEDLDDTQKELAADQKFLAELTKGCATKTAEWEERCKTRTQELLALADTIKILNDDDALELFKKTLPAPTLLQLQVSNKQVKSQALRALKGNHMDHRLALVAMAIRGSNSGTFDKVIGMIDKMVALLGQEQKDDDEKKAYCDAELDKAEDDLKILNNKLEDLSKAIDETKELIQTLTDEIAALVKKIAQLDDDVTEATATRKAENELYKTTMAQNTAALEILKMARNRLAKFYTPKLYKPPAKKELSRQSRIMENMAGKEALQAAEDGVNTAESFVQISEHKNDVAPPPPPETWDTYAKKGEENAGVTEMMQILMTDLETEMTQMTTDEKESQREYEAFIADAAATRKTDTESMKNKESQKADAEANLDRLNTEHKDTLKAAYDQTNLLKDLHLECDWLLANFENRKAARAGEVKSLKDAKAVLSGADYSLMQRSSVRNLRG